MDRAEAEAIYDLGREACVVFILELAGRVRQHEDRLRRSEEQARQDSRTSSKPPSQDPAKTRAQRRAEARATAKELMRREREERKLGGQSGHRGSGRDLNPRIRSMSSSITTPWRVADAAAGLMMSTGGRAGGSAVARCTSCRRSARS